MRGITLIDASWCLGMSGELHFRRNCDNDEVRLTHGMHDGISVYRRTPGGDWRLLTRHARDETILDQFPDGAILTMPLVIAYWQGAGEAFKLADMRDRLTTAR